MAVAVAAIVPSFLAASGLVLLLELAVPRPAPSRAAFLPLCVFLGVVLSVKALPVLACI